jgi:hypothetical protein
MFIRGIFQKLVNYIIGHRTTGPGSAGSGAGCKAY